MWRMFLEVYNDLSLRITFANSNWITRNFSDCQTLRLMNSEICCLCISISHLRNDMKSYGIYKGQSFVPLVLDVILLFVQFRNVQKFHQRSTNFQVCSLQKYYEICSIELAQLMYFSEWYIYNMNAYIIFFLF